MTALLQVVFVNVALSADNAVVIGMASLGLPAHQRLRALWLGVQPDGFIAIEQAGSITSLGVDAYYSVKPIARYAYAKPNKNPERIG